MAKAIYKELEQDIVDFFNSILTDKNLPVDLKYYFQSVSTQKSLVKLTKIPDQYNAAMNKDILVQVNEDFFDHLAEKDDLIKRILFEQEIDNIEFNTDKGTFKIGKPNFTSNLGIIQKYTFDKVKRAQEVEKLYLTQKEDDEQS
jgi:hypothetical protein